MLNASPARPLHRAQRGFSILELLVGAAVGMVVVSGAAMLFANNVVGSRKLLAESRLNQDLRNAADLVTRDIRRAGYWGNAIKGTNAIGVSAATPKNPYRSVQLASNEISYGFSRESAADNDVLDEAEKFGFRLHDEALQMQTASGWADVTDKTAVRITTLVITPTVTSISLGDTCPTVCTVGTPNCPTATVRSYALHIGGESARDAEVRRSLRSTVRVRNDEVNGACPA